jgi:CO/xanthine dehydrogenase Mo-binding subunit
MQHFIHDIAPKRSLRARVFRSPLRKGTVSAVRRPDLPRGYFCVGQEDVPGSSVLSYSGYSLPVLVKSKVRYLGEPLLLFCGSSPEVLARLASAVELSYEEQSPVEYKDLSGPYRETQIINLAHGDVDLAFSLAEQIVEGEYRTARQEHYYPDTQGAWADWDGKLLTIHSATQDPFGLQLAVARCLDLPARKVRVVAVATGNTMEGKLLSSILVAAQAGLLACAAKKPVVLVYDREEDLHYCPKGPQFLIRHQTALDQDGGTMAVRVQIIMDGGCYAPRNSEALHRAVHSAWGVYQIPNLEVTGRTVSTDFPPIGPFRSSGLAQAVFAAELHSSRLGEIAQLDPYDWKRKNLAEAGRRVAPASALAVLEEVAGLSDFIRKYSAYSAVNKRRKTIDRGSYPLRGIGLSLAFQRGGGQWTELDNVEAGRTSYGMKLVFDRSRRLRIYTSLADSAMGIHAILVNRAAELLELDPQRISVQEVDTHEVPDTGPTILSQAVTVGLPLLEQCCAVLQRKRKGGILPIEVRRSLSAGSSQSGKSAQAARARRKIEGPGSELSWAATVIEVELDPVTFQSSCRGVWAAIETGTVWNRTAMLGVLEGEILRWLGSSHLAGYTAAGEGAVSACSAGDLIPGVTELPEIQIRLLESQSTAMKGFDDLPCLGVPAAYAAAVCQATGLYIDQLPITAEVVQQCLET